MATRKRPASKKTTPRPKVSYLTIGPEVAAQMLLKNSDNRAIKRNVVKKYVRAMTDGSWNEDAWIPLHIDSKGQIVNAQHRLTAIVESGMSFEFMIIQTVADHDEVFSAHDTGSTRNLYDLLQIKTRGELINTKAISTLTRHVWMHDNVPVDRQWTAGKATPEELLAAAEDIIDNHHNAAAWAFEYTDRQVKQFHKGTASWHAAVFLIARDTQHEHLVQPFIEGVVEGANLPKGDARLALSKHLVGGKAGPQSVKQRRKIIANIIRQWNNYVEGNVVERVSYKEDQSDFPEVL